MSKTTHVVTLSCKHSVIFEKPVPKLGEEIICNRCRKGVTVTQTLAEYHLKCLDCSFRSKHGAAKIGSEMSAGKHRTNKPGHRVQQWDGETLIRTFGDRDFMDRPALF